MAIYTNEQKGIIKVKYFNIDSIESCVYIVEFVKQELTLPLTLVFVTKQFISTN